MRGHLFHFSCSHGAAGITRDGLIKPNRHSFLGASLVWLTDLEHPPTPESLGLTSYSLECDRLEYRFAVEAPDATHWPAWAHRVRVARDAREALEGGGAMPAHWWVAEAAVPVVSGGPSGIFAHLLDAPEGRP